MNRVSTKRLETLPNIDINIKCGNSLISRYALDADIKKALRKSKWTIDSYQLAVMTYRNARSKDEKRAMEKLITQIKNDFESEIAANDKRLLKLNKLKGELYLHSNQQGLFELDKTEKKVFNKKTELLTIELRKLETELEEITNNRIYENAFEWRFEFPEVLNDEGDFMGFDVVIGNPPYGATFNEQEKGYIRDQFLSYKYKFDSYVYFIEHGLNILKTNGLLEFIVPILWLSLDNCYPIRKIVTQDYDLKRIFAHGENIFEEAIVNTCSFQVQKSKPNEDLVIFHKDELIKTKKANYLNQTTLQIDLRLSVEKRLIIEKMKEKSDKLSNFGEVIQGITPYDSYRGQSDETIKSRAFHFDYKKDETCGKWLDGRDLNRYLINWNNKWLSYGSWLAAPRDQRFFEGERILFREIPGEGKKIQASISNDTYYYGHSISPFKPYENHLEKLSYFLGIVNSRLTSWYASYTLSNFSKDIFPKLNPNDIKEILIPSEFQCFIEITNCVQEILYLKQQNPSADTTALESEIDLLVYRLYQLTWDEVKIVDPDFAMDREEYDGLEP